MFPAPRLEPFTCPGLLQPSLGEQARRQEARALEKKGMWARQSIQGEVLLSVVGVLGGGMGNIAVEGVGEESRSATMTTQPGFPEASGSL